jgi:hypothetical protein
MQEIYFLTRHTPFWAIPLIVLGAEFGYVFWLRKKKANMIVCFLLMFLGVSAVSFYIWAGGPEKSVKVIKQLRSEYIL